MDGLCNFLISDQNLAGLVNIFFRGKNVSKRKTYPDLSQDFPIIGLISAHPGSDPVLIKSAAPSVIFTWEGGGGRPKLGGGVKAGGH